MKNIWKICRPIAKLATCFAISVLMFCMNGLEVNATSTGTISSDSAKVRKEANTTSEALGSVVKGDSVAIVSEEKDSAGVLWYKVTTDANIQGYIRSDLMKKETGASDTTSNTPADNSAVSNVTVGANTTVTPIQSQTASVTSDNVRVRADASTKGDIVTTIQKTTALTAVGQAVDGEGKTWYQVDFMVNNGNVSGFIRSDFIQLSAEVVIVDPTATPEVEVPEETPEEPMEPEITVNNDYELRYEASPEGPEEWYLYFNAEGYKSKLSEILAAADTNGETVETAEGQLKTQKIIIVVLAILLVVLALTVTLLLFKIRDLYYEDFEDYDDEPQRVTAKNSNPRTVKPSSGTRPVANGKPAGANTGSTQRTTQGSKPVQGNRPAQGSKPVQGSRPPQGNKPVQTNRPAQGSGTRPAPQQGERRPDNGPAARPNGAPQSRPAAKPTTQTQRPAGNQNRPASANNTQSKNPQGEAKWKSRNFMTEDDEFEFEFLNWDGEDKS